MPEDMTPPGALFDPSRHEALTRLSWDADRIRDGITAIAHEALLVFTPDGLWPAHPLDEPPDPQARYSMLYMGAGGVIWGLRRLAQLGHAEGSPQFECIVPTLVRRNREVGETQFGAHSFLMGDSGLLLLEWRATRSELAEERLFDAVRSNLRHRTREMLWGSPGTMLAALHVHAESGGARWEEIIRENARILLEEMDYDESLGAWLWTQDMYGRTRRFIGAGHGFAGNVYPILRASNLLPPGLVDELLGRAWTTLNALALRDGNGVNWHAVHDPELVQGRTPLVQDCHGAPGIVVRLAGVPRTPAWDSLLCEAGELTWRAGPLRKGPSLCHGTAGNGYAFLKLWKRTGDALWLQRARAFAMHALLQVEAARREYGRGRFSLWTGDIGAALFFADCLSGAADFPTLDCF